MRAASSMFVATGAGAGAGAAAGAAAAGAAASGAGDGAAGFDGAADRDADRRMLFTGATATGATGLATAAATDSAAGAVVGFASSVFFAFASDLSLHEAPTAGAAGAGATSDVIGRSAALAVGTTRSPALITRTVSDTTTASIAEIVASVTMRDVWYAYGSGCETGAGGATDAGGSIDVGGFHDGNAGGGAEWNDAG